MQEYTVTNFSFTQKNRFRMYTQRADLLINNPYLKFIFISLVGATLFFGLYITPDGFSYLEAANNTLRGYGFVVNCNLRHAFAWQPLYSYLMIPYIFIFGYTVHALILYHLTLFIICFFVYDRLLSNSLPDLQPTWKFLSIAVALYSYYTFILSEAVFLIFIGLYVNVLLFHKGKKVNRYINLAILLVLIFSTKNAALLVIVPIHLSLIELRREKFVRYYIEHGVYLAGVMVIFLVSKLIFQTTSSHTFELGSGTFSLTEYIIQIYRDFSIWIMGRNFMSYVKNQVAALAIFLNILGLITLVFTIAKFNSSARWKVLIFLLITTVIHLIVFSSTTPLAEPLNERYLFWFTFLFIFMLLYRLDNKYLKSIFILMVVMNVMHIGYNRYKVHTTSEVVLKPGYLLDSRIFETENPRPPSLVDDAESSKKMVLSPAYPWYVDE